MAGTMHPGQQAATVAGARKSVTHLGGAPRYDLRGGPLGGDGPRGTAGRAHVRVTGAFESAGVDARSSWGVCPVGPRPAAWDSAVRAPIQTLSIRAGRRNGARADGSLLWGSRQALIHPPLLTVFASCVDRGLSLVVGGARW